MIELNRMIIGDATLYHAECEDIFPHLPRFDLVLTDPPYGLGEANGKNATRSRASIPARDYGKDTWDDKPISDELMKRVISSAHKAIIFGGNYYRMDPSPCWLIWDKINGASDFADCELAWTNLDKAVRLVRFMWNGMLRDGKELRGDHPTQKPIALMEWCLAQHKAALTVFDPFMGSGTTGVACVNAGVAFTGIERKKEYFDIACERIERAYRQGRLRFDAERLKA